MDKRVYKAYGQWINSPTPFENHYLDKARFYSFVAACVKYVKTEVRFVTKEEAWKSINMDILKEHLIADLSKTKIAGWEDRVHETLIRFETFLEYEKIRYSQVEMNKGSYDLPGPK